MLTGFATTGVMEDEAVVKGLYAKRGCYYYHHGEVVAFAIDGGRNHALNLLAHPRNLWLALGSDTVTKIMRNLLHSIILGLVLIWVPFSGSIYATPPDGAGRMKPVVVGVLYTISQVKELPAKDRLDNYTGAIKENGGSVVLLAQTLESNASAARLASIDALLIPGGDDVSPDLYGEKPLGQIEAVDRDFDLYELAAIKQCVARGIPILGICKGHQLLAVATGGALYQDLPTQLHGKVPVAHRIRNHGVLSPCYHEISLKPDSVLARLFKTERLKVNSYHHQGVKTTGDKLHATAWSDDGLIEAMESGKILSTQFHPEKERKADPAFNAIFTHFLDLARAE